MATDGSQRLSRHWGGKDGKASIARSTNGWTTRRRKAATAWCGLASPRG